MASKMNHRTKNTSNFEAITCEKLLNRLIRQEKSGTVGATKKSPLQYQEKHSTLSNVPANKPQPVSQRPKSKAVQNGIKRSSSQNRNRSPGIKQTVAGRAPSVSPVRREIVCETISMEPLQATNKYRQRSTSSCASASEREPWGQKLLQHKSRERVSTFSNFDPLRTLHFLSKELQLKLQTTMPDDHEIIQMVSDIQHALKRIPPEVASLIHLQQHSEFSLASNKSILEEQLVEKLAVKSKQSKICQTPPTLYQEDTDRFQKLMEENTIKLEASIKQLEVMCASLQQEKETCDKELEQAKQHVSVLCNKIKELEQEIEDVTNVKVQRLEQDKSKLQKELDKIQQEARQNPTLSHFKKLVEELRIEKSNADQKCARLEYDMTILAMEKEKLTTILSIRDSEIQNIQEEMSRIQEQVGKELERLNVDVLSRVSSLKTVGVNSFENLTDIKDNFEGVGDATISSIATNDSVSKDPLSLFKEPSCGDGEIEILQENQENIRERLTQIKGDSGESAPPNTARDEVLEDILKGMTSSCKALFSKAN